MGMPIIERPGCEPIQVSGNGLRWTALWTPTFE